MGRGKKSGKGAAATATPTQALDVFRSTDEDRARFAIDSTQASARNIPPADFQEAWNGTSAADLEAALPTNDNATAIARASMMPTPREMFGRPGPERPAPNKKNVQTIADALSGGGVGYSELRRQMGIDKLPAATDTNSRRANAGGRIVGLVAKAVTQHIPADAAPQVKARAAALIDTIGGLSAARERNYEQMILTQGPGTPKGRVLSRVGKQIIEEARRAALELNRTLGYDATPGPRGTPKQGTPGYDAYTQVFGSIGMGANIRAQNVKRPRYEGQLGILNNN